MTETIERPKTAMVVVAHPDDAEFGCGGTLAKWSRDGWEITIVIVTDASGGGADDAIDVGPAHRAEITRIRKAEQHAAARVLGVKHLVFLDQPDGRIEPSLELRKMLVRLYRRFKPTRMLCQPPDRIWKPQYMIGRHHPDHLAVGTAAIAAMYPASQNAWDFPELLTEGLQPHKISELYVMGAAEVNYVEDIADTLDTKIAGLREHRSQLEARFPQVEERVRTWAADNGKAHNVPAAELFHRAENG
jgi:LmbE family N-acetylglucosaminyl deacetylase